MDPDVAAVNSDVLSEVSRAECLGFVSNVGISGGVVVARVDVIDVVMVTTRKGRICDYGDSKIYSSLKTRSGSHGTLTEVEAKCKPLVPLSLMTAVLSCCKCKPPF
jgi:hypothetical protein